MPLRCIVVGLGISGLCTAIALRKAGHQAFEKSACNTEAGTAILIAPNGERVLRHLGCKLVGADAFSYFEVKDGVTLQPDDAHGLRDPQEEFGAPLFTIHRADLQNELMMLAAGVDMQLKARVSAVDCYERFVELDNGERYYGDLIIGADGVHSVLRAAVIGEQISPKAEPWDLSAFRFTIPTAELQDDPHFKSLLPIKGHDRVLFADATKELEHHLVWFTCRRQGTQVFIGVHEAPHETPDDLQASLLAEFNHFHPSVTNFIKRAANIVESPLFFHEPLANWRRGGVVLVGDAAHPMLPLGAQGANQAIEDAGSLGVLFRDVDNPDQIPKRLDLFDKVRRLRASRVQILSKVRLGKERDVEGEVRRYADPPGSAVPTSFSERYQHDYNFNVLVASEEALLNLERMATDMLDRS